MIVDLTHTKGLVFRNQYHVIFCPKYRRSVLTDGIEVRLKEILRQDAEEMGISLEVLELTPNHVHLYLSFDPRIGIHNVVKRLKATTSRILRDEFPSLRSRLPSLWTRSYFCCTVGQIDDAEVERYIEDQKGV